jgi:hypothetical protein
MSLRDAIRYPDKIRLLAHNGTVVTHSAGITALHDIIPKELIAIAPPMPTRTLMLVVRSFPKTISLIKSAQRSSLRRKQVISYHLRSLYEHAVHVRYNSAQIGKISQFNTAFVVSVMLRQGSRVRIGIMEGDLLFPDIINHPHIDTASVQGALVTKLDGEHDDFLFDPIPILDELIINE